MQFVASVLARPWLAIIRSEHSLTGDCSRYQQIGCTQIARTERNSLLPLAGAAMRPRLAKLHRLATAQQLPAVAPGAGASWPLLLPGSLASASDNCTSMLSIGQFIATSKLDSFTSLLLAASSLATMSSSVWETLARVQVRRGIFNFSVKSGKSTLGIDRDTSSSRSSIFSLWQPTHPQRLLHAGPQMREQAHTTWTIEPA